MALNGQFFQMKKAITAAQLAATIGAELIGSGDRIITDITAFTNCSAGSLCFLANIDTGDGASELAGAIVVTTSDIAAKLSDQSRAADVSWLIVDNPRAGFAMAANWLVEGKAKTDQTPSIAPSASIADSAIIASGAKIGEGTIIGAGAVIGDNVVIGAHCRIGANAVVSYATLADNVTVKAGCVIGESGFGFEMTKDGPVMVPHLGIVRIGQGSHIGANSTIDRGSLDDTILGEYVMIDNLVQIAHNCILGDRVIIASQVGIAGSTTVGSSVVMGGQVGVADHINIGDGAVLMARAGITKDVPAGAKIAGFPGEDASKYWRDQAKLRSLLRPKK